MGHISSDNSIIIRLSNGADLPAYTSLLQRTYSAAYVNPEIGLTPECFSEEVFSTEHTQEYLKRNLQNGDSQSTWLAFEENKLIGSITAENKGSEFEVRGFYVDPFYQDKGIGKLLWNKAVEYCKGKDIVIDAYVHNEKAISMYKKWGFKVDLTRGDQGYFYRHWPEWPFKLNAKCIYMRLPAS